MEWISVILVLLMLGIALVAVHSMLTPRGTYISWSGDPDPKCDDCEGTGLIDVHGTNIECPCTMLIIEC